MPKVMVRNRSNAARELNGQALRGRALAALKRSLLTERAKLANEPDLREALLVERQEEVMDQILADEERELAGERVEGHTRLLHRVDAALARIEAGHFGTCESCGESIAPARLKAIPWTEYCLSCQERAETSKKTYAA